MKRKDRIDALGALVLLSISMLFGLNQVLVKLVNAGLQPVFQASLRSIIALVPLLLFVFVMKRRLSIKDGSLVPGLICGLFFSLEFLLLFLALDYTTVTRASVIFYCMPVWLAIGAHFLVPGDRLTGRRIFGLAVAIAGMTLAISSQGPVGGEWQLRGDIFCVLASICWACIALLARTTALNRSSPEMQLLYQLVVSSVVLLPASLFFGEWVRDMTWSLGGILVFQSVFVVMVGFLTWFWVLSIYPTSDMASFTFLVPAFGVLSGWLILNEQMTAAIVVALLLISIGIYLINSRPGAKPQ
ncbi:MAG: DMT family transporter [Burkholderiaceae bacterium]